MAGQIRNRTLIAIVVLAVVCLAASVLYLLWTVRPGDSPGASLQTSLAARDPRFPEQVALLLGVALTRGDQYEVLVDGDQAFPRMIGAIESAEQRISLQTDAFAPGEVASEFTRALATAAARDVVIRLIVPTPRGDEVADGEIEDLELAGALVRRPTHSVWSGGQAVRSRRWILVIDGTVAFTGGIGIADQYRGHAHDRDHWRGTQIRIAGPAARQLEGAFLEAWLSNGGGEWLDVGPEPTWSDGWTRSVVLRSNSPGNGVGSLLYRLSIAAAERRISIATSSLVLDDLMSAALDEALVRGVQIRLLTSAWPSTEAEDTTDAGPGLDVGPAIEYLVQRGLELHEYQPTRLESRVMVVDGVWSVFGSSGFDFEEMAAADGLIVGVHDPDVGARLDSQFDDDLLRSARVTPDASRESLSPVQRILEWLR